MRYKRITQVMAMIIVLIMVFGTINAQTINNRVERRQDRQDIIQSRYNLADSKADYNRLSTLIERWNEARRFESNFAVNKIERKIDNEIKNDIVGSQRMIKQFAAEVERSQNELRYDINGKLVNRINKIDSRSKGHNSSVAKTTINFKEDLQDLKDDIRDLKIIRNIYSQKQDIANSIKDIQMKINFGHGNNIRLQNRQLTLMQNYLKLENKEIKLALRELQEDKFEYCEDSGGNPRFGF
ncbi:MAG: hypothetical protein ABIJ45_08505 [Candidatus Zixiibacteriota bacterium]